LSVAVQIKQNSPASKLTVLEVEENELPPLVPLHAYVGLLPSALHVNTSLASYGVPPGAVMVTLGRQSVDKVVFVLQISVSMTLTLPSCVPLSHSQAQTHSDHTGDNNTPHAMLLQWDRFIDNCCSLQ